MPNSVDVVRAVPTMRELQTTLPWTIRYSRDYRANPQTHKDFAHALHHVSKAAGKLHALADDMDHDREVADDPTLRERHAKYVADLVVCALRIANVFPGGVIDLQGAVESRIIEKNGLRALDQIKEQQECQSRSDRLPNDASVGAVADPIAAWRDYVAGKHYRGHGAKAIAELAIMQRLGDALVVAAEWWQITHANDCGALVEKLEDAEARLDSIRGAWEERAAGLWTEEWLMQQIAREAVEKRGRSWPKKQTSSPGVSADTPNMKAGAIGPQSSPTREASGAGPVSASGTDQPPPPRNAVAEALGVAIQDLADTEAELEQAEARLATATRLLNKWNNHGMPYKDTGDFLSEQNQTPQDGPGTDTIAVEKRGVTSSPAGVASVAQSEARSAPVSDPAVSDDAVARMDEAISLFDDVLRGHAARLVWPSVKALVEELKAKAARHDH